jgi:peptidoglycan/xylan/chitin deacetylase (PgdA/CDA1 family)
LGRERRRKLKNAYFQGLDQMRIDAVLRALNRRRGRVAVLNFHRVSPDKNPYWSPMSPEAFRELMRHLHTTCEVATVGELANRARTSRPRVVLSFDDGCRDFVEYAMPILAGLGLRANHNLIIESVEQERPPWMIRLIDALRAAPDAHVRSLAVPGAAVTLRGSDDAAKTAYATELTAYLKSMTPQERRLNCPEVVALVDDVDASALTPMMNRADVAAAAEVHELGGHSYDHETLSRLDEAEFLEQVARCQAFFDGLGRPMNIFAFPYGSHRPEQIRLLQQRGVEHVLLVDERLAEAGSGVYTRITMYGDSQAELKLRAMGHRVGRLPRAGG